MDFVLIRERFLQGWLGEVVEGGRWGQSQKQLHFDGEDPSEAQSQLHCFLRSICDGGDCLRARCLRSCSCVSSQHSLFQVVILKIFTVGVLVSLVIGSGLTCGFCLAIISATNCHTTYLAVDTFFGEANSKHDSVHILLVVAASKWKLTHFVKMNIRLREVNFFLTKTHVSNRQIKNLLFFVTFRWFSEKFAGFRDTLLVFGRIRWFSDIVYNA